MKRETLFLKVALVLMGIPILAMCIFGVPEIVKEVARFYSDAVYLKYVVLLGMYGSAIAYFCALYQAYRLLSYIDKNDAFSELSVGALRNIKKCALITSGLLVLDLPIFYLVTREEDAPGVMIIGLIMICAPLVIAVFAAVLQKLLRNAIDIQSENDLTV